jgi:hypothetical protein
MEEVATQPKTSLEPTASPATAKTLSQFEACSDSGRGTAWGR